jgi:enterochelin esterase-like enzyme
MELLQKYWWLIWAIVAVSTLAWWRMRSDHSNEPFLRRLLHALVPRANPQSPDYQKPSARMIVIVAVGGVMTLLAALLVKLM